MSLICWNGWTRNESMFLKIKKWRALKAVTGRWWDETVLEIDDLSFYPFCVSTALWTFSVSFVNGHSNTHRIKFSENYVNSHMQSSQCWLWYRAGSRKQFAGSKFKNTFYCKLVELSCITFIFQTYFASLSGVYQEIFTIVSALPAVNLGHIKL